jgi:hypothetical protein
MNVGAQFVQTVQLTTMFAGERLGVRFSSKSDDTRFIGLQIITAYQRQFSAASSRTRSREQTRQSQIFRMLHMMDEHFAMS